ncbi:MAG: hypothetical protein PCFJNLEI_01270 [Verrucomicrobiae bacterium]|nr:hypothetical protein [Verrucomicrobiae bacterium]
MQSFAAIECPHCGETFEIALDSSEPDAEFVIDCEICCRPMTVTVHDGEVHASAV